MLVIEKMGYCPGKWEAILFAMLRLSGFVCLATISSDSTDLFEHEHEHEYEHEHDYEPII